MTKNSNTRVTDPQIAAVTEGDDRKAATPDTTASGMDIDFEATVNGLVEAFQPLAAQLARLEKANELWQRAGYAPTNRDGEVMDLRELNRIRSQIAYAMRGLWNTAFETGGRFKSTGDLLAEAQFRAHQVAENDPEGADVHRVTLAQTIAEHAHDNVARPLAVAAESIYEMMLGVPMQEKAAAPKAKKVTDFTF